MSWTRLSRELWAQIMGALDPGTDLYADVLAIAPVMWDADLTGETGDARDLALIAADFPGWTVWRPPSPHGTHPWWGARDGHTVIITSTGAELRAALTHHRDTGRHPLNAEVFSPDRRDP